MVHFLDSVISMKRKILLSLALIGGYALSANAAASYDKLSTNIPSPGFREFVDAAKTLRDFADDGGGYSTTIQKDEHGWPLEDAKTVIFDYRPFNAWSCPGDWCSCADNCEDFPDMRGVYKVSFKGQATLSSDDASSPWEIRNQRYDEESNTTTCDLVIEDPRGVLVYMKFTDTHNPESATGEGISDLRIIRPGYHDRPEQTFTDEFIAALAPFKTLRFMDWVHTNGNNPEYPTQVEWQHRRRVDDATQNGHKQRGNHEQTHNYRGDPIEHGVAWEYIIELSNETGKDPWINLSIAVSDDYIDNLAQLFADTLSEELTVYVEISNEIWNEGTPFLPQTDYRKAAGGHDWHVRQLLNISERFRAKFSDDSRIRPILAWRMRDPEGARAMLELVQNSFPEEVSAHLYAISPALYFTCRDCSGSPEDIMANARQNIFDDVIPNMEAYLSIANSFGVKVVAYEGGQHIDGLENIDNKIVANKTEEMGELFEFVIKDLFWEQGGDIFSVFSLATRYNRHGSWGLTQDIYVLNTPKYQKMVELSGN